MRRVARAAVALAVLSAATAASFAANAFEHEESFEAEELDRSWWQRDEKGACSIQISQEKARAGKSSLRFDSDDGARCEIVHWPEHRAFQWFLREPFGEDRWYGFSVYLTADRSIGPLNENEVIAQWHASDDPWFFESTVRGPPLALRIQGSDWRISHGYDRDLRSTEGFKADNILWKGHIKTGRWTDWVFHVVWSIDDDGLIEVWKDGVQIATYRGPSAYNDLRGVYLKLGSYHPRGSQTLYIDEVRVGNDRRIATPLMAGDGRVAGGSSK